MVHLQILEILLCLRVMPVSHASNIVHLRGAGASFPANVYQTWLTLFTAYRRKFVTLETTYQVTGSGNGKKLIMRELEGEYPIDYAGSDSLLTEANYHANPDLQMLPSMAG